MHPESHEATPNQPQSPAEGKKKPAAVAVVKEGPVAVNIYSVAAPGTRQGFTFKFKLSHNGKEYPGTSTDLDKCKIKARRVAKMIVQGMTDHVKAADISELVAVRRIAEEHSVPTVAAMQEWAAAKTLAGPALLSVAQQHADAAADGKHKRVTHAEAWELFIAAMDKLGRRGTLTYGAKARMIIRGLSGQLMLDTLKTGVIRTWADTIDHPVTRNDLIKRLGTMIRWAQRHDFFPADRAIPTDNVDRAEEPETTPGTVTPEQLKRSLEWVRRNHLHYLAPLAITSLGGMRNDEVHGKRADKKKKRADMRRQLWKHVQISPKSASGTCGIIHVTVAKKNTPTWRKIPIQPALAAWLALCPRDADGPNVCIAGAMERVRELLRKADADLGFPKVEVEIAGEKVLVNDVPENCFRHSFITYRIPVVGIVQTAAEAGNSTQEIDKSYRVPMTLDEALPYWDIFPDQ